MFQGALDTIGGPIKGAITSALQTFLSRYIKNVELTGAGVTGDIVLQNLDLRLDVLRKTLMPLGFAATRGFIKELRISIPWLHLASQPIVIKFNTVECILTAKRRRIVRLDSKKINDRERDSASSGESSAPEWIQSLLTNILANIRIQVNDVNVKYVHRDIVLCFIMRSLHIFTANPKEGWAPCHSAPTGKKKCIHKACEILDASVLLDRYKDGEFGRERLEPEYEENPVLDRASFTIRTHVTLDPHNVGEDDDDDYGSKRKKEETTVADTVGRFGEGASPPNVAPNVLVDPFFSPLSSSSSASSTPSVAASTGIRVAVLEARLPHVALSLTERQISILKELLRAMTRAAIRPRRYRSRRGHLRSRSRSRNKSSADEIDSQGEGSSLECSTEDEASSDKAGSTVSRSPLSMAGDVDTPEGSEEGEDENDLERPQSSWTGWAWNAVLGDADSDDSLEAELLAEDSEYRSPFDQEAQQQREGEERRRAMRRFMVAGTLKVGSLAFTLHRHVRRQRSDSNATPTATNKEDESEFFSVPVPTTVSPLGVVKVRRNSRSRLGSDRMRIRLQPIVELRISRFHLHVRGALTGIDPFLDVALNLRSISAYSLLESQVAPFLLWGDKSVSRARPRLRGNNLGLFDTNESSESMWSESAGDLALQARSNTTPLRRQALNRHGVMVWAYVPESRDDVDAPVKPLPSSSSTSSKRSDDATRKHSLEHPRTRGALRGRFVIPLPVAPILQTQADAMHRNATYCVDVAVGPIEAWWDTTMASAVMNAFLNEDENARIKRQLREAKQSRRRSGSGPTTTSDDDYSTASSRISRRSGSFLSVATNDDDEWASADDGEERDKNAIDDVAVIPNAICVVTISAIELHGSRDDSLTPKKSRSVAKAGVGTLEVTEFRVSMGTGQCAKMVGGDETIRRSKNAASALASVRSLTFGVCDDTNTSTNILIAERIKIDAWALVGREDNSSSIRFASTDLRAHANRLGVKFHANACEQFARRIVSAVSEMIEVAEGGATFEKRVHDNATKLNKSGNDNELDGTASENLACPTIDVGEIDLIFHGKIKDTSRCDSHMKLRIGCVSIEADEKACVVTVDNGENVRSEARKSSFLDVRIRIDDVPLVDSVRHLAIVEWLDDSRLLELSDGEVSDAKGRAKKDRLTLRLHTEPVSLSWPNALRFGYGVDRTIRLVKATIQSNVGDIRRPDPEASKITATPSIIPEHRRLLAARRRHFGRSEWWQSALVFDVCVNPLTLILGQKGDTETVVATVGPVSISSASGSVVDNSTLEIGIERLELSCPSLDNDDGGGGTEPFVRWNGIGASLEVRVKHSKTQTAANASIAVRLPRLRATISNQTCSALCSIPTKFRRDSSSRIRAKGGDDGDIVENTTSDAVVTGESSSDIPTWSSTLSCMRVQTRLHLDGVGVSLVPSESWKCRNHVDTPDRICINLDTVSAALDLEWADVVGTASEEAKSSSKENAPQDDKVWSAVARFSVCALRVEEYRETFPLRIPSALLVEHVRGWTDTKALQAALKPVGRRVNPQQGTYPILLMDSTSLKVESTRDATSEDDRPSSLCVHWQGGSKSQKTRCRYGTLLVDLKPVDVFLRIASIKSAIPIFEPFCFSPPRQDESKHENRSFETSAANPPKQHNISANAQDETPVLDASILAAFVKAPQIRLFIPCEPLLRSRALKQECVLVTLGAAVRSSANAVSDVALQTLKHASSSRGTRSTSSADARSDGLFLDILSQANELIDERKQSMSKDVSRSAAIFDAAAVIGNGRRVSTDTESVTRNLAKGIDSNTMLHVHLSVSSGSVQWCRTKRSSSSFEWLPRAFILMPLSIVASTSGTDARTFAVSLVSSHVVLSLSRVQLYSIHSAAVFASSERKRPSHRRHTVGSERADPTTEVSISRVSDDSEAKVNLHIPGIAVIFDDREISVDTSDYHVAHRAKNASAVSLRFGGLVGLFEFRASQVLGEARVQFVDAWFRRETVGICAWERGGRSHPVHGEHRSALILRFEGDVLTVDGSCHYVAVDAVTIGRLLTWFGSAFARPLWLPAISPSLLPVPVDTKHSSVAASLVTLNPSRDGGFKKSKAGEAAKLSTFKIRASFPSLLLISRHEERTFSLTLHSLFALVEIGSGDFAYEVSTRNSSLALVREKIRIFAESGGSSESDVAPYVVTWASSMLPRHAMCFPPPVKILAKGNSTSCIHEVTFPKLTLALSVEHISLLVDAVSGYIGYARQRSECREIERKLTVAQKALETFGRRQRRFQDDQQEDAASEPSVAEHGLETFRYVRRAPNHNLRPNEMSSRATTVYPHDLDVPFASNEGDSRRSRRRSSDVDNHRASLKDGVSQCFEKTESWPCFQWRYTDARRVRALHMAQPVVVESNVSVGPTTIVCVLRRLDEMSKLFVSVARFRVPFFSGVDTVTKSQDELRWKVPGGESTFIHASSNHPMTASHTWQIAWKLQIADVEVNTSSKAFKTLIQLINRSIISSLQVRTVQRPIDAGGWGIHILIEDGHLALIEGPQENARNPGVGSEEMLLLKLAPLYVKLGFFPEIFRLYVGLVGSLYAQDFSILKRTRIIAPSTLQFQLESVGAPNPLAMNFAFGRCVEKDQRVDRRDDDETPQPLELSLDRHTALTIHHVVAVLIEHLFSRCDNEKDEATVWIACVTEVSRCLADNEERQKEETEDTDSERTALWAYDPDESVRNDGASSSLRPPLQAASRSIDTIKSVTNSYGKNDSAETRVDGANSVLDGWTRLTFQPLLRVVNCTSTPLLVELVRGHPTLLVTDAKQHSVTRGKHQLRLLVPRGRERTVEREYVVEPNVSTPFTFRPPPSNEAAPLMLRLTTIYDDGSRQVLGPALPMKSEDAGDDVDENQESEGPVSRSYERTSRIYHMHPADSDAVVVSSKVASRRGKYPFPRHILTSVSTLDLKTAVCGVATVSCFAPTLLRNRTAVRLSLRLVDRKDETSIRAQHHLEPRESSDCYSFDPVSGAENLSLQLSIDVGHPVEAWCDSISVSAASVARVAQAYVFRIAIDPAATACVPSDDCETKKGDAKRPRVSSLGFRDCEWSADIFVRSKTSTFDRKRFLVPPPRASDSFDVANVMLSCIATKDSVGTWHFVLYRDSQPPLRLRNRTDFAIEYQIVPNHTQRVLTLPRKSTSDFDLRLLYHQVASFSSLDGAVEPSASDSKSRSSASSSTESVSSPSSTSASFTSHQKVMERARFQVRIRKSTGLQLWSQPVAMKAGIHRLHVRVPRSDGSDEVVGLQIRVYYHAGTVFVNFEVVDKSTFASAARAEIETRSLFSRRSLSGLTFRFHIPELSISLFHKAKELVHAKAHNVGVGIDSMLQRECIVGMLENSRLLGLSAKMTSLQVDNFVSETDPAKHRLSVAILSPRGLAFRMNIFSQAAGTVVDDDGEEETEDDDGMKTTHLVPRAGHVESVELSVGPTELAVDDALIKEMIAAVKPILEDIVAYYPPASNATCASASSHPAFLDALAAPRLYIGHLRVGNIQLIVTLRATEPVFVALDRTPLALAPLDIRSTFASPGRFAKNLAANYVADALIVSPALLGSLEILGNPTAFLSSVFAGVHDLVTLPVMGAEKGGLGGLLNGVGAASVSFSRHLTQGTLQSLAGFSASVARNLDRLSFDSQYVQKREAQRRGDGDRSSTQSVWGGVWGGVSSLGASFLDATTGLVTRPVSGGMKSGLTGALGGVATGLAGVVAKPLGAAFDAVSQTSHGLLRVTGYEDGFVHEQMRAARQLHVEESDVLRYRWKVLPAEAEAEHVLCVVRAFEAHERTDFVDDNDSDSRRGVVIIVLENRMYVITIPKHKIRYALALEVIESIGLIANPKEGEKEDEMETTTKTVRIVLVATKCATNERSEETISGNATKVVGAGEMERDASSPAPVPRELTFEVPGGCVVDFIECIRDRVPRRVGR
eukprot:g1161.t1